MQGPSDGDGERVPLIKNNNRFSGRPKSVAFNLPASLDETDETVSVTDDAEPNTPWAEDVMVKPIRILTDATDYINDRLSLRERIFYYIPVLSWLKEYKWHLLRGDAIAGLTVAVMLVPQTLAFANLMSIKPIVGLQTGFFPLLVYFALGTCKQLAIGPEAVVAILTSGVLDDICGQRDISASDADVAAWIEYRTSVVTLITLLVGLFSLILGLVRFGFLVHMFSRSLLSGFINAVAIHIIVEQLPAFFALPTHSHSFKVLKEIWDQIDRTHMRTFWLGIICLSFLVSMRIAKGLANKYHRIKYIRVVPDILIVVALSTIARRFWGGLDGVSVLGKAEAGFAVPAFPRHWDKFGDLISAAFSISIVGMMESTLVANSYASKLNYRVSTNRELVAIGMANIFGSIFQTFPAFASLGRSAVNFTSGARSAIASLITATIVLFCILFFLPYLEYLPKVTMSAVIINAAFGLFEVHELFFLWKIRAYKDISLFLTSFIATNIFGVELGIGITAAVSLFLIVKHTSSPHVVLMKQNEEKDFEEVAVIRDINLFDDKHDYHFVNLAERGILIMRVDEALYFANIGQIRELMTKLEQRGKTPLATIIIDASNIPFIDPSAAMTLHEMIIEWKTRHINVCFVRVRPNVIVSGILDLITTERIFARFTEAMDYLDRKKVDHHSTIESF
ncbi:hypothetical protein PROFUN_06989 [Planoprotostelium fungivorum]|uniref:STAS domain-containing protein n=1 Tax=Planoprotostelium fungivorum TaxID=1890364 RepID=A0A2P6NMR0_9EUKA|nr:hypothetical protein PROFUN_06989 [Planoprotostelium fungivorum]